ncbi:hypothetical protein [Hyphomonas sp. ND6WE1B]|uniref:hypothetical protein n=1 Tax=Hyphomonas sp. ND6WE1B TaxID=1848191 RepID=UPI0008076DC5|nr:hypothetical protein [Hyphomonas sp. ND6WE1B]
MRPNIEELLGEESDPLTVDAPALASVLGITVRSVHRLAAESVIERKAGRYDLRKCVRAYLAHRLDSKPGVADKARKEKANADLLELKAAQMAGKLLDAAEVEREWASVCRDLRAALLALPGRLSARLPHLGKADLAAIDSELREALTALGGDDGD